MADSGHNVDLLSIEANEVQHDAVLDYYGRRLATCSSDKTIKIFEVEGEKHTLVETLRGSVMPTTTIYTMLTKYQTRRPRVVRGMGASQVRQYPRILFIRRQGHHLARAVVYLAKDLRSRPPHRLGQHRRMGAT